MRVVVTGGAGFIGSHCVDALIAKGHDVAIFDRVHPLHTTNAAHVIGDLLDPTAVEEATKHCDLIVHAGGILGTHETVLAADETIKINILGTMNILKATTRHKCKLINISKPNVWLNPYSITKDCAEKLCFMHVDEFDAQIVTVKLYNVYGPRQKYNNIRKAIPTWIVDALNGSAIEVFGTGKATIDLIHVRDVAQGILAIVENFEACRQRPTVEIAADVWGNFPRHNAQILELGSGTCISVIESVAALCEALAFPAEVKHLPMRRGEIDGTRLCADITKLNACTGFTPKIDLISGFRETVDYYKAKLPDIASGVI